MTIQLGDHLPAVKLKYLTEGGMAELSTVSLFAQGVSILFGLPGCYTPECALQHIPSYTANMAAFKASGVDRVACLAVNDPFVMQAWLKLVGAETIQPLPDGNGVLTRAMGLEFDASSYGMGLRTRRFAMIIRDGVVAHLAIEKPGLFEVSTGDAMLRALAA